MTSLDLYTMWRWSEWRLYRRHLTFHFVERWARHEMPHQYSYSSTRTCLYGMWRSHYSIISIHKNYAYVVDNRILPGTMLHLYVQGVGCMYGVALPGSWYQNLSVPRIEPALGEEHAWSQWGNELAVHVSSALGVSRITAHEQRMHSTESCTFGRWGHLSGASRLSCCWKLVSLLES